MPSVDFLIARLPVFDRWLKVRAYELRLNSRSCGAVDWLARLRAEGGFGSAGEGVDFFDTLTGKKLAIMRLDAMDLANVDLQLLPGGWLLWPLINEKTSPQALNQALRSIRKHHQGVVLDAAFLNQNSELTELADILALDMHNEPACLEAMVRSRGKKPLLAVDVDTEEDFLNALRLGSELFQGRFYVQPKLGAGHEMPAFRLNLMRLLVTVHNPVLDYQRLEKLVSSDVTLAYKLLRYINSPYFGVRTEVQSVRQAFSFLGEKALRNWISMVAMSASAQDKPDELVVLSLVRALFFSQTAEVAGLEYLKEEAFLAGLFSLLDAFFDKPMPEILEMIPVTREIKDALLHQSGILGALTSLTLAYEKGKWDEVGESLAKLGADKFELLPAYQRSLEQAHEMFELTADEKASNPA
ncbi:EAL and HDOD domain-containing protein [Dethiosulfatarculus sandiegensis]|uniref:EAL and HDOD domain-containing protein n=1 Tax=Dethiosulfatarculus sandiegensis TaxID=1429043 RepID=UPI0009EB7786|nr:HDOD domain-containing protein [Dethiosulfatarculus sandiegensis]